MTVYRRIEIVNGESAEPVAWVGVHPVNWPGWVGAPDAGFVEDEAAERRLAAAERLAEALEPVAEIGTAVASSYGDDQIVCQVGRPDRPAQLRIGDVRRAAAALAEWTQASANESAAAIDAAK